MAIYHHTTRMIGRSNGGSPVRALAYISGVQLTDERTGEIFNFKDKSVDEIQILLPSNAPIWAKDLQKLVNEDPERGLQILSDMANRAEKRDDAQVYREIEFSLPRELTYEQRKQLATDYVQDQFCSLGMLAIQSFHTEIDEKTGGFNLQGLNPPGLNPPELNPHCHTFFLTRELTEEGLAEKKNRDWNGRDVHEVWREQWAQYASFHLKMHGHDITLDHRSYADQGLDIEPQVKLGKGVKEQERRAQGKKGLEEEERLREKSIGEEPSLDKDQRLSPRGQGFIDSTPATERVQELRSVRLRNLYRILRRPETVFDIVTRHHATFMWGDVQKILGRYVDTPELFQRLDARLKNSSELLLLKTGEARDQTERIEERSIYTTRSMLRSEKALVSTAEALAGTKDHAVSSAALERGLERIQARLQTMGCSLSSDQTQAIEHLVSVGQLKCIVGYAGAGKTTALEACKDIWEDSGYKVYGLAPTGRAAQNLEGSGISSQTLHKFLKSFEEGRCQYSGKSVLVLDEAGMVDVERFEAFLGAVKALGVKAVVVGDGAQLQPVEAGPAFRLVTERVGVSRLESVVRQRQDWQREATVLFGKQESKEAIRAYQHRGHVHLVDEALPQGKTVEEVISLYEISARSSGLIFREIMKEIKESYSEEKNSSHHVSHSQETQQHADESQDIAQYGSVSQHQDVSQHRDYAQFLKWRNLQKDAGRKILGNAEVYGQALEARGLDPLEMARLFVDKKQDKSSQYKQAGELLKDKGLDHLIGGTRVSEFRVEVRSRAKAALIEDWKRAYNQDPQKSLLMMAYSNRDVRDLNMQVRSHLKASGVLGKEDMAYTITQEVEDDFGRKKAFKQKRSFSKGDKLVFTRNNFGLGVQNGTVGTITDLNTQNIKVKVGETQEVSFAPRLNPYFDQGWAVTIHKSQGTTVDKSFLLASHEMNQNLTYVAMTRHREDVQVYGSHLDFWRTEKVADILSKSGEKLGAADYLDSHSLAQLMKDEDRFLTQLFTRLGDELHAMRAVSKQVFKVVLDHFLGRPSESALERPTLLRPEILREEDRAHEIFQKTQNVKENKPENGEALPDHTVTLSQLRSKINRTIQDVYEDWKHPAFKQAGFYKRVFEKGLNEYGEQESVQYWNEKREPYRQVFEEKIEHVERELQSPFLSYMSDKSRDLARKAAFEDPDRALNFLNELKASKQAEQLEKENSLQHKQESLKTSLSSMVMKNENTVDKTDFREVLSSYFRFKELRAEYERSPYDPDLQKELKKTGEALFNNKEGFNHIKGLDPDLGEIIKKIALDKQRDLDRSLERILQLDRGGLSL